MPIAASSNATNGNQTGLNTPQNQPISAAKARKCASLSLTSGATLAGGARVA